jgi:dihydropyrimidinase
VHAENGEGVALGQQVVFDAGVTGPEGHALSRPAVLEGEATARAIKLASFVGVPLYVVHVMSEDALGEVRACLQQIGAQSVWCLPSVRQQLLLSWH